MVSTKGPRAKNYPVSPTSLPSGSLPLPGQDISRHNSLATEILRSPELTDVLPQLGALRHLDSTGGPGPAEVSFPVSVFF